MCADWTAAAKRDAAKIAVAKTGALKIAAEKMDALKADLDCAVYAVVLGMTRRCYRSRFGNSNSASAPATRFVNPWASKRKTTARK